MTEILDGARLPLPTRDDPAWVADGPSDLTPEWVGAALRRGGLDVEVRDVRVTQIGTGQIGASYRVGIEYSPSSDADAPRTVVVKLAFGDEVARRILSRAYVAEVGFYLHLADRVRARIPRCWSAAISSDHHRFTLVMEDLAPSVPGSQTAGCDVPQAHDALVNLAGVHAPYWNNTFLREGLAWLVPSDAKGSHVLGATLQQATGLFVERFGSALPAADAETLRGAADVMGVWSAHHQTPYSLIHGDYRPDNLMFGSSPDSPVAALDWQGVSIGHPARDVAYFLGCSLPTPERRAHERDLVEAYHAALVAHGVTGYSADACFDGYRVGMLQGPLITVLGCVYSTAPRTPEADAMFLSMTARLCAAIRDLDTLDAVRRPAA